MGLFKRKSKLDKLQSRYEKLMAEAHKLSVVDRAKSDEKVAEANMVLVEMDRLEK